MIKKAFYILTAAIALSFVACDENGGEENSQTPEVVPEGGDDVQGEDGPTQPFGKVLFEASDLDEEGWIWFDTAEKIEKYIGVINETDYLVDPEGKPIQLVYADIFPDYPASEASADFTGAGIDGETGSEGSRTGAIMLQPSSGSNIDGGGFVVCMPSCHSYAICYSSNSKVMARILATTNVRSAMSQWNAEGSIDNEDGWRVISATYTTIFKRLPAGINTWDGLEELNNGYEPKVTMKSNDPIYAWFQNGTKDTVYIHGIKVETKEPIAEVE